MTGDWVDLWQTQTYDVLSAGGANWTLKDAGQVSLTYITDPLYYGRVTYTGGTLTLGSGGPWDGGGAPYMVSINSLTVLSTLGSLVPGHDAGYAAWDLQGSGVIAETGLAVTIHATFAGMVTPTQEGDAVGSKGSLTSAVISIGPAPLVQDSFDGAALDPNTWQVLNGDKTSVVQSGGQVKFNRPATQLNYLLTAEEFDPAVTPLIITGSVTLGPDGDMDVWTRASNKGNSGGGPGHVLDSGIRVNFWRDAVASGYPPVLDILEKTSGKWPWNSSISGGANIPGSTTATDWNFVITDDGTTITATFTQTSDPTNTLTLKGVSDTEFDKNHVAFTVVNGWLNCLLLRTRELTIARRLRWW